MLEQLLFACFLSEMYRCWLDSFFMVDMARGPFLIGVVLATALWAGLFSETIAVEILFESDPWRSFFIVIFHASSSDGTLIEIKVLKALE